MARDQHHEENAEEKVFAAEPPIKWADSPHGSEHFEDAPQESDDSAVQNEPSAEEEDTSEEVPADADSVSHGFSDQCNLQEWELLVIRGNTFYGT